MGKVTRTVIMVSLLLLGMTLCSAPAFAQMDFSGEWNPIHQEDQPERAAGPDVGDYTGIPINDAARMRGDTWAASIQTLPEWQCRPHSADYIWRGPSQLKITKETDPVTRQIKAFHVEFLRSVDNPIWLDGRPHPPEYAEHTWGGFSTGVWDGQVLTVTVTHLKEGYLRRNGLPRSDKATITQHIFRHGDYLTAVIVMNDPVYLTEPFVRSSEYRLNLTGQVAPYPCSVVEEITRPYGSVPSWLPGQNPDLTEYANKYELPFEATRGGPQTMYPEYSGKLSGATPGAAPPRR
jgi:hypothetical protein